MSERRVEYTEEQRAFLEANHAAVMVTLRGDGTPHAVRVGVALVDGNRLWSSGTRDRVRTKHLRRDPRCTVTIVPSTYSFLTIESTVTILEGEQAPAQTLKLFRTMQGKPTGPLSWFGQQLDEEAFLKQMAQDHRIIYQFDPRRIYSFGL